MTDEPQPVTPRIEAALGALDAAEKARQGRLAMLDGQDVEPVKFSDWYKAQDLELAAVPVLLKLARAAADRHQLKLRYSEGADPIPDGCMCGTRVCPEFAALAELVAVLDIPAWPGQAP